MPDLPQLTPTDAGALVRAAESARDRRDWSAATASYQEALGVQSNDAAMWVQLGHALKEGGDPASAGQAYARALAIDHANADTHLQMGHALKLQHRRAEAIAAYAEAARLDPQMAAPRYELIHLGARDALPEQLTRSTAMWARLAALGDVLAEGRVATREWVGGSAYPLAAYDRFRRDIPVRPPPGPLPDPDEGSLVVLIDAGQAAPFLVRASLRSLQDQSVRGWRAIVVAPVSTREHPVGGFAQADGRIAFVDADAAIAAIPDFATQVACLTAGTILDPEALAWLLFARARTGAEAVHADHDHGVLDAVAGLTRADPWLPGVFDARIVAQGEPPAVVIAGAVRVREAWSGSASGDQLRRSVLARAAANGPVPHVARLLATMLDLPLAARGGTASDDDAVPGRLGAPPPTASRREPPRAHHDRIAVVIPTRDAAGLLARAIDTLRARARDAGRLDIVVVDNRSAEEETRALLAGHVAAGTARVVTLDAPFNWSLASNLGAQASDAPVLLFANNDLEMLTPGWDDRLCEALAGEGVGAVGARLLYPDMTVQHGGMVFGMGNGYPEHEGRARAFDDPGPDRRLVTTRFVAAVTGAFMAVRRDRFDAVGGFDAERLFIGHSDVDLCLKLREAGGRTLYLAEVEAIHHESKTRGRNETKAQVAWDESERGDLVARWGTALEEDPGVSPYWAPRGVPFDGLREPSLREVVRHLDLGARADPWKPTRRAEQEAAAWRPEAL